MQVLGGTIKAIILAGGKGTRLGGNYDVPKPLVCVGGYPVIYHVIKQYAKHNIKDFIIAAGYKKDDIVAYFASAGLPYSIEIVDTGINTTTGGRVLQLMDMVEDIFMVTYADGISDIDITWLLNHHIFNNRIGTVTAVHPPARFGQIEMAQNDAVITFAEKERVEVGWINGGFMVFKREVFSYLKDGEHLEGYTLKQLASDRQLTAYRHYGFWQCVDTPRDVEYLNELLAR